MSNDLHTCECGSSNIDVEWEENEEQTSWSFSMSYLEYYVECYDCGKVGKSAPSYELSVRNWNNGCMSTE